MIFFRADANEKTGAGHMMRCLTIAQAVSDTLKQPEQGDSSFAPGIGFVCADEASAALPASRGFRTHILHTDYRDMESELALLSALMAENAKDTGNGSSASANVIVVDSYFVTDAYLAVLRAFARVVLIDDNMERTYPADVILNYNFHADADAYRALYANDAGTRIFTGPRYAPLREQFADRTYRVKESVEEILVLAGGSDPLNTAGAVTRVLLEDVVNDISNAIERNNDHKNRPRITVVCGPYNPHAAELAALAKQEASLRVLRDVEDMASLMCASDLCVSACGSTLYELCAVGLPFVCFSLADNQDELAAWMGENGPAPFAGAFHRDSSQTLLTLRDQVTRLATDYEARVMQCVEQRRLVDGLGARHIAKEVLTA